jgi:TatD DNase family protein
MTTAELFDTHAHFEGTTDETSAVLRRAAAAGVTRILAVGGSEALNRGADEAARLAPPGCTVYRSLGWDRDQAGRDLPAIDWTGVAAVGEIGLDYHYSAETRREQCALMARQLETAVARGLPAVLHTREADDDTLGLLREIPARGIVHSFTGDVPFCRALLDLGWFISFSGIVTFRSAETVRASARFVPDDRILVETDSPYLAPMPLRGRVNEPANLVETARFTAALRRTPFDRFAARTMRNSCEALGAAAEKEGC